jgi:putative sporulation protein YyaC
MLDGKRGLLSRPWMKPAESRVHMDADGAVHAIEQMVSLRMDSTGATKRPLVILCIGSDRSIGDALGPLVGTYIEESHPTDFTLYGSLRDPVHATNLVNVLDNLNTHHRNPFILAVDACLGRPESIGMITVGDGSLKPGAGVNKSLPVVGDMYITGVVNVAGFMEYFVLQNTRLSLVVTMAKIMAQGILRGVNGAVSSRSVPRV